jgi:hypothetical protein
MNSLDLTKVVSTYRVLFLVLIYSQTYESCFAEIKLIGEGGFSKVYEVINKVDQCHYAIK